MNTGRNTELGTFLTTYRARLDPPDEKLRDGGYRRVPGLRREEVAGLAGVSPDYYARLEQGRQVTASPSVLDAVARALQLSDAERAHLYALAGVAQPGRGRPGARKRDESGAGDDASARKDAVDDKLRRVLDSLGSTPAIVCGPYLEVVAVNPAAAFLFTDFGALPLSERNALRWMLLAPAARDLYGAQWEESAGEMVGMLRIDSGRHPKTRRTDEIIAELEEKSPLFRRLWQDYRVTTWHVEEKELLHPTGGSLTFHNTSITVEGFPDLTVFLVIPDDRTAFEAAFTASRNTRPDGMPGPSAG